MVRGLVALGALLLLAPAASAANPVNGSVFGPIVSVKGSTFTITTKLSPSGRSLVSAGSARITEQATAPRTALKVGACVMATGLRNAKGVVAATRIGVSAPVNGRCGSPFAFRGRPGGTSNRPPRTGTTPRPFQRNGNFGFAFGQVTSLKGSTMMVKSPRGATTVTVSSKTALSETKTIKATAVRTKMCAFVRGTSSDKGVTVKATDVSLTPEIKGACTTGFQRPSR